MVAISTPKACHSSSSPLATLVSCRSTHSPPWLSASLLPKPADPPPPPKKTIFPWHGAGKWEAGPWCWLCPSSCIDTVLVPGQLELGPHPCWVREVLAGSRGWWPGGGGSQRGGGPCRVREVLAGSWGWWPEGGGSQRGGGPCRVREVLAGSWGWWPGGGGFTEGCGGSWASCLTTAPSRGAFWAASWRGSQCTAQPLAGSPWPWSAPLGAGFITSAAVLPRAGAGLSCLRGWWDPSSLTQPCVPRSLQSTAAQLRFLCREVFFKDSRSWGFFCLMDFLFLIQLKGSEIHALD